MKNLQSIDFIIPKEFNNTVGKKKSLPNYL